MPLNIPMPESPGSSLLKGLDTGSSMMSRLMQPVIERERLRQQQQQFAQDYLLKKQAQDKQNSLLPYMIQQYQDTHRTAAGEAQMKELYRGILEKAIKAAANGASVPSLPGMPPGVGGGQPPSVAGGAATVAAPDGLAPSVPDALKGGAAPQAGGIPAGVPTEIGSFLNPSGQTPVSSDNSQGMVPHPDLVIPKMADIASTQSLPVGGETPSSPATPTLPQATPAQNMIGQEQILRPAHPGLEALDAIGGLIPNVAKPVQHISNGMIITTYPSGKMTAQPIMGGNSTLHGPARDAADLEKLKNQAGEKSEVYQNAKAAYDAGLDAKKDLRDLRARTKEGLKPGEKEFFDPASGKPLGKEVPYTEKERDSEQGNIMFNELYPIVYKGAAPFSGEGSITRLQKAAANYKTDPQARKLFDDFLLANKMLAATTVNEASTLKARGTNTTYQMLKASLDAQDIPRIITKLISQYNIPSSAQLTAAMRYQKALSDARNTARKTVPATQKLFYDPQKQAQYEQQDNTIAPSGSDKEVIVIDPNKKRYKTTEANAANLPAGWTRG